MGFLMESDLLATTSEQIMETEAKFDTRKNLLSLTFPHDHFSKNLKIDKTSGGFKKRSQAVSFFSFILINFYHFTFGMTVYCIYIKKK